MKNFFKFIAEFFQVDGLSSATRLIFIFGSFWNMAICSLMLLQEKADMLSVGTFFLTIEGVLVGLKLYQNKQENGATKPQ